MKKQKQKKPEKSPEWVSKLSSALKKNLQRRKVANKSISGMPEKIGTDNKEV